MRGYVKIEAFFLWAVIQSLFRLASAPIGLYRSGNEAPRSAADLVWAGRLCIFGPNLPNRRHVRWRTRLFLSSLTGLVYGMEDGAAPKQKKKSKAHLKRVAVS
jgi:hypothetical protein